jgi:transposase InsO family protein
LKAEGFKVGHERIARLMREANIKGVSPRRFRKTTDSRHRLAIAPNVINRQFDPSVIGSPDRVWAGDTTFISTRSGWLYLAVVIDLYSRMVVGWSMSTSNDAELASNALLNAIAARKPSPGTIFHSDRGSTYASSKLRGIIETSNMRQSMSRKGDCWDNAPVESFFGTLKTELQQSHFESHDQARAAIFNYIETWYNRGRLHSTLDYQSPIAFEKSQSRLAA